MPKLAFDPSFDQALASAGPAHAPKHVALHLPADLHTQLLSLANKLSEDESIHHHVSIDTVIIGLLRMALNNQPIP